MSHLNQSAVKNENEDLCDAEADDMVDGDSRGGRGGGGGGGGGGDGRGAADDGTLVVTAPA